MCYEPSGGFEQLMVVAPHQRSIADKHKTVHKKEYYTRPSSALDQRKVARGASSKKQSCEKAPFLVPTGNGANINLSNGKACYQKMENKTRKNSLTHDDTIE